MLRQQFTTIPNSGRVRTDVQPRISAKNPIFANVFVGPKLDKFTIHEDLLTFHSGFFRKALRGSFEEARNKIVKLDAEDNQIFEFFVHWLYYQRLPNKDDAKELNELWTRDDDGGTTLTENLMRLYIFCDTFQVRELKIRTMTELFYHMEEPTTYLPSGDMVELAFENLPEDAPLLRFLVDMFCLWAKCDMWANFENLDWPLSFIGQVLTQYSDYANRNRSRDDLTRPCDYHAHQSLEERAMCEQKLAKEEENWSG